MTKIDHRTGEYKGNFEGKVQIMSYSKNFEDQVLEFMKDMSKGVNNIKTNIKDIKLRLDNIENRLDVLETFHKEDFKKLKTKKNK